MGHKILAHAPKIAPTGLKRHKIKAHRDTNKDIPTKTASTGPKRHKKGTGS